MANLYDPERIQKISTIMPNFASVAQRGDVIRMGLEGDPFYNKSMAKLGTIESIQKGDVMDEKIVSIRDHDSGNLKQFSSSSIKPNEVWEFTDESFKKVLNREQEKHRAEAELKAAEFKAAQQANSAEKIVPYRGELNLDALRSEITELKTLIQQDQQRNKDFNNTVIETMKEIAGDVCKMDTGNNASFCKIFEGEYTRMLNRSEAKLGYRGSASEKVPSDAGSNASSSKYRGNKSDIVFSDDESLASNSDSDA
jgi:hypothetical protein